MSALAFKLLEGNSDLFNSHISSELNKNNITEFNIHIDYNSDIRVCKPSVRFFSDNLSTNSFNTSLELLTKSLKKLPEFQLYIETLDKNFTINERDDLNTIFEKTFIDFTIYNPETNSYVLFEAKSSSKNKANKVIDRLSKDIKDGWEKVYISTHTNNKNISEEISQSIIWSFDTELDIRQELIRIFKESKVEILDENKVVEYILENYSIFNQLFLFLSEIKNKIKNTAIKIKFSSDPEINNDYLLLNFTYEKNPESPDIIEKLYDYFASLSKNLRDCIVLEPEFILPSNDFATVG